jgi:hypothetical protein
MITCDCSVDVYEGPSVSSTKTVKARKQHQCCECLGTIEIGELYETTDGCWDGSWDHFKTCSFCVKIRKQYCPNGHIFEGLQETINECLGFMYASDPADWPDEPREPEPWQLAQLKAEQEKNK